jgi:hypothetical protein
VGRLAAGLTAMASTLHDGSQPTASEPNAAKLAMELDAAADAELESSGSSTSSRSGSEAEGSSRGRPPRPKLHKRKSSGTIIVSRDDPNIERQQEDYDEGDARAMSPRRSSEEVDRLEETARQSLIEYANHVYPDDAKALTSVAAKRNSFRQAF